MTTETKELLNFDEMFLGTGEDAGCLHLESTSDIELARREESGLLLSAEAEKFVKLICLHGMLPSEAYEQAFAKIDDFGNIIKPSAPAYQARLLLRLPEIKDAIEIQRAEIRSWTKTEAAEIELTYRSIMMSPESKDSDRVAAGKALSALRGFDAQPDVLASGATITIALPWTPNNLSLQPGRVIEHSTEDVNT